MPVLCPGLPGYLAAGRWCGTWRRWVAGTSPPRRRCAWAW